MAKANKLSGRLTTRRTFLELTGAAIATAGAVRASTAADDGPRVRVAVIGTGARGSDLLRSLTTVEAADVVGIADDYEPHLKRAGKYALPTTKAFADYRRMLDELKPQAVVIAVPLYLHYQVASDAIEAGCDVFCEKTMCYSVDQAQRLVEKVDAAKRVFQVGLQRRANPIYQQAVAMVQAGLLGQITAIKAQWHRNNNWRRPVPVSKSDPQYAALEHRLNWRLYKSYSQGLMAELGSHQMDVANWLLGVTPKRVLASGGIDYWTDGREVADNIFCVYDYELPRRETPPQGSGVSATEGERIAGSAASSAKGTYNVRVTYSSICNNAYEGAAELVLGTKGSLFLTSNKGLFYREKLPDDPGWIRTDGDQNAAVLTAGKTLKMASSPWAHRGEPMEIDLLEADDTRDELVSFIDHVRRHDTATICDAHEGLRDTATVVMANEAMEQGAAVEYPG